MILASKFPGRCITCGGAVVPGQMVEWIKGRKGVVCCLPELKARAAVVEQSRTVDADIDVPAPAGLDYLAYQRGGIAYATKVAKEGVLFGDEMGLGKTIQAIGVINADPNIRRALVICPKSLTINWVRELRKWLVRPLSVYRVSYEQSDDAVVVCSFEEAKKFQDHLTRGWDLVVLDEAHKFKNPKAQRTKAIFEVTKHARRRFALTGTPIENKPVELFTLLALVAPGVWTPKGVNDKGQWKDFFAFGLRYCGGTKTNWGWDFSGASNLPELQNKLRATCMIRRLKKDVLKELPPKRRQIVVVHPGGAAAAIAAERAAWAMKDDPETYDAAAQRLSAFTAEAFAELSRARHQVGRAKVGAVIEHVTDALEDDVARKIVVMAIHVDVIDEIMAGLAEFYPVRLTGQVDVLDRQDAVDRFQKDPRCRVFVGNMQAAGVGITLTASSHMVFAEQDWVPGVISQAEDRIHRIGQDESVLIQHIVLDGSLDARMIEVVIAKQQLADRGLDVRS